MPADDAIAAPVAAPALASAPAASSLSPSWDADDDAEVGLTRTFMGVMPVVRAVRAVPHSLFTENAITCAHESNMVFA